MPEETNRFEGEGTGRRPRVAEQTAERLREAILSGEVGPGEQLPAERDLAARLGVSRLSLRAAIARLEAEGLLRSVHGSGTQVLDFRERGGLELIAHLVRLELEAGRLPMALLSDVLELRRVLASEVLVLAAKRRTHEDLAALREAMVRLRSSASDPQRFMADDLALARRFVRSAHNLAIELVFNAAVRLLEHLDAFTPLFAASAEEALGVYERLLQLVELGDAERVGRVSARLLARLDRHTLAALRRGGQENATTKEEGV